VPNWIDSLPIWLICLVLFLVLAGLALGVRALARRKLSDDTQEEVETHAGKMITGLAAAFAFFAGVAITMTWGAISSAQTAVEDLTAKSQQVGWAIGNIEDTQTGDALQVDLTAYANAVLNQDMPELAAGATADLPSDVPMSTLQDAVHSYAFARRTPASESTALVSAVQALGSADATLAAVAERTMPSLMGLLLLVSAVLLSMTVGLSSLSVSRPFLAVLWCFVIALTLSLVLAMDHPFGGVISVNLQPLADYVATA
jgi:uncharacterized membrane protein